MKTIKLNPIEKQPQPIRHVLRYRGTPIAETPAINRKHARQIFSALGIDRIALRFGSINPEPLDGPQWTDDENEQIFDSAQLGNLI